MDGSTPWTPLLANRFVSLPTLFFLPRARYLIHDSTTGQTAAVDTPCAASYKRELERRGWTLTHILNTHHHSDHVGGNMELKTEGVQVYGPAAEKIPGMDVALKDSDTVSFAGTNAVVMGESWLNLWSEKAHFRLWTPCLPLQFTHLPTTTDVGGHTLGHIAYYFPTEKIVFVGDSLFALGCGRMFEGTPQQYWTTLQSLRNLPDDTVICKWLDLMCVCVWFGRCVVSFRLFVNCYSFHRYHSSIFTAYSSLLWCTSCL